MKTQSDSEKKVYEKINAQALSQIQDSAQKLEVAIALVKRLRAPDGCPWDKEQTHLTLRPYLIEEAYEVLDVLDQSETNQNSQKINDKLKEELGDLLLQILLHSELKSEKNEFTVGDVALALVDKLVRRHPHVFGEVKVNNSDQVLQNWEAIKSKEKEKTKEGLLDGLPKNLPSLQKAARIGEKAQRIGFDWPDWQGSMKKVEEELLELKQAIDLNNKEQIEMEMGDLFFSLCNLSRHLKIQPEDAHRMAILKFEKRFQKLEEHFRSIQKDIHTASLEELDNVWIQVKKL